MPRILVQPWEESERGWGVRPDGVSLHLSEADRDKYLKIYWASMPDPVDGRAPDTYSRPSGTCFWSAVRAGIYDDLRMTLEYGMRFYDEDWRRP